MPKLVTRNKDSEIQSAAPPTSKPCAGTDIAARAERKDATTPGPKPPYHDVSRTAGKNRR